MYSNTMSTFSKQPKNAVMFQCCDTVVYTRNSARNCVVTTDALDCNVHLSVDLELYNIGFLHNALEAEPCAIGARFAVWFGGAQ